MRIFVLLFVVLGFAGCSKTLDTLPYSFNTVDKLYTSESGAELALTGCYSVLNTQSIQGNYDGMFTAMIPFMFNGGTDEAVTRDGFSDTDFSMFGNYSYTSQSAKLNANWCMLFAGVNRTNYFIENIDAVAFSKAARKDEMKGEAHFLRALYYVYLSWAYGGVPVFTSSQQSAVAPRDSVSAVYRLIIEDLNYAYENLLAVPSIDGRASKWSAAGFLAKVYTYLASCKMNSVGANLNNPLNDFSWVDADLYYQKALAVTSDIISNSGLKLTAHYDYLFRETTAAAKKEESLFSVLGSSNLTNGNYNCLVYWQIPIGSALLGGGYGYYRPTGELYNRYSATDFRLQHNVSRSLSRTDVEVVNTVNYYVPQALQSPLDAEYCVAKYRYRDAAEKSINYAWSDGDLVVLRYADILMLDAEARYFTGDEAGGRSRLKEVLGRVAIDDTQLDILSAAYHDNDFLTELLASRSRELCFEGWRRLDLIRFGKLESTIAGLSQNAGYWNTIVNALQSNLKPYKIWFPIPKAQVDLNPNLQQNDGYN